MYDKSPATTTNELPSPDRVLSSHVGNSNLFRCPSDKWRPELQKLNPAAGPTYFEQTGSSYSWNFLLNGEDADHLKAMGLQFTGHEIPLLFDKEKFHIARGTGKEYNFLYADGHIKNLLAIEGSIQRN